MEFSLNSKIVEFKNFEEFNKKFSLGKKDLILTNEFIYNPYLKKYNLECSVIFQEKYGNGEPTDTMIDAILKDTTDKDIERVIAIGGGTVIDISKIIILKNSGISADLFMKKIDIVKEKELVVIPTTCGTGSEVTNISIAFLEKENIKMGLAVPELYPDYAVLIPEFLETLPYKFFCTSSIDALVHATESYLSPKATVYSEMFSEKAIELLINGFKYIAENGEESRKNKLIEFLQGSNFAGIAFGNAGCAAVHALSYPLGGRYHIPHGESNQLVFISVFKKYKEKQPNGKIEKLEVFLGEKLGVRKEDSLNVLEALLEKVYPKKKLEEYGIKKESYKEFAKEVLEKQQRLLSNNYVELTEDEIVAVYENI